MLRQPDPVQHEVKLPSETMAPSRFYVIEPMLLLDGYSIQVRRLGDNKIVWRCLVSFDTAADSQQYQGAAIMVMIEIIKSDLDQEFIK